MAKKSTTRKTKRTPKTQATEPQAQTKRPDPIERKETGRGAPIEHFHGENPTRGRTGDPGDLEDETLDRDAPYNKTYGRR
jgi:hypothetical protein